MKRLLLVPVLALAACSTPLTSQRLEPSFARTFSGLYALQQTQDGRHGVQPDALGSAATCQRSGTEASGPGEDWVCQVTYQDGKRLLTQSFEVQVKSDGCWKAEAPPTSQPVLRADPVTGATHVNPLSEFDGCLDTSWR
ncbi:MAG TPA: hypothetical protein VMZ11_08260 [Mycobacteriales bacterium]|nr:hypothetical protein [Mycobacteriales bacterium]